MKPKLKLDHRGLEAVRTHFWPDCEGPPLWKCESEDGSYGYGEDPQKAYCAWVSFGCRVERLKKPSVWRQTWDFFFAPVDIFARIG